MGKPLRRLALHRETLRTLSEEDLSRVAGAIPSNAQRWYSIRDEYTCQCDTGPWNGCEWVTISCGTLCA